jgi:hypothetical protein
MNAMKHEQDIILPSSSIHWNAHTSLFANAQESTLNQLPWCGVMGCAVVSDIQWYVYVLAAALIIPPILNAIGTRRREKRMRQLIKNHTT